MRGQIPNRCGQLNADIAANLAHPNLLTIDRERSEPQPQMSCCRPKTWSGLTGALIFAMEQEGLNSPINTVKIERLVQLPSALDE
jgi:hypothetical protein